MSGGSAEPTYYNTTADVDRAASDFKTTNQFVVNDFVVGKKPTEDEVQIYKDVLLTSEFSNTLWMDMAVTKWWSGSGIRNFIRFARFPFLFLLAMSLMVYFPSLLINDYWPSGIQCMRNSHGWKTILACEAVIVYLFSITGFNRWALSDDSQHERNQGTWSLYIMLSSYTTRHRRVIILGYIADILCRGFLITATAWGLMYSDPELEEILVLGVEMNFLMEVPHVMRFMSEERMVTMLVSAYEEKGVRYPNFDAWQKQNKWLVRLISLLESAALIWSVVLPVGILFCM